MKDFRDWLDVAVKVILAVAGVIVGYYFSVEKQQNDDIKLVVDMATAAESSKHHLGWAIAQAYQRQGRIPQEVYVAIATFSDLEDDPQLRKVVNSDVGAASKNDQTLRQAITNATEALPVRIYFHVRRQEDKNIAETIRSDVESAFFGDGGSIIVPGVQVIPGSQSTSILKCFKKKECATVGPQLIRIFEKDGVNITLSDQSLTYETATAIRPNHFEAWFAPEFTKTTVTH